MRLPRAKKRGSLMLGMAALTVIVGTACAMVLLRSFETYRASAIVEWRLQARAAAEGAAILLSANPETRHADERIGEAFVVFSEPVRAGKDGLEVSFTVGIAGSGDDACFSRRYRALFQRAGSGGYKCIRLETL